MKSYVSWLIRVLLCPLRLGLVQTVTQILCSRWLYIGYSFRAFYLIRYFLPQYVYYCVVYWDSGKLMTSGQILLIVFGRYPHLSLLASVLRRSRHPRHRC